MKRRRASALRAADETAVVVDEYVDAHVTSPGGGRDGSGARQQQRDEDAREIGVNAGQKPPLFAGERGGFVVWFLRRRLQQPVGPVLIERDVC